MTASRVNQSGVRIPDTELGTTRANMLASAYSGTVEKDDENGYLWVPHHPVELGDNVWRWLRDETAPPPQF